jgi:hypothetical protein
MKIGTSGKNASNPQRFKKVGTVPVVQSHVLEECYLLLYFHELCYSHVGILNLLQYLWLFSFFPSMSMTGNFPLHNVLKFFNQ